jgi:hypothetical protein
MQFPQFNEVKFGKLLNALSVNLMQFPQFNEVKFDN